MSWVISIAKCGITHLALPEEGSAVIGGTADGRGFDFSMLSQNNVLTFFIQAVMIFKLNVGLISVVSWLGLSD